MAKDTDLQALSRVFKVMENLEISGNWKTVNHRSGEIMEVSMLNIKLSG